MPGSWRVRSWPEPTGRCRGTRGRRGGGAGLAEHISDQLVAIGERLRDTLTGVEQSLDAVRAHTEGADRFRVKLLETMEQLGGLSISPADRRVRAPPATARTFRAPTERCPALPGPSRQASLTPVASEACTSGTDERLHAPRFRRYGDLRIQ